jgi:two-component system OmpR family sensor kinase
MSHIFDRTNALPPRPIPRPRDTAEVDASINPKPAAHRTYASHGDEESLAKVEELKARIAELQAAVAARDDFLAVAAHELRNPMTPILGQVERLNRMAARGSCNPDQIRTGLNLIEQLVRLFIKRATTLLDVSRMTSGKLMLHVEAFDASALIRRIVDAHEPAAEHLGSVLAYREQAPVMVALDALALEQILDNILLNALRYGGGKPIDITLGHSDALIWTVVKDRGIGIPLKDQSKIFERFEQAVSSATQGGFGVGLWVVGQLVQAMGGEIKVDSAVNEGTSFQVTLPRFIAQTT